MKYKPVSDSDFVFRYGGVRCDARGTWGEVKRDGGIVSQEEAIVRCVDCGGLVLLGPNHTFSAEGKIQPSVGCPWCGWHVWGQLEGWGNPAVRSVRPDDRR